MEPTAQPIINIWGERVALGPIRRDLMPAYERWVNDFEATRYLAILSAPMTTEAETAWYESARISTTAATFTVYERATLRPIGSADLHAIEYRDQTAEFGILIGERDCWNKGYGTETARLVLDYGFNVLGLHSIWLTVYTGNDRAIRAYEKAGFKHAGRRREAHRIGQRLVDVVYMDCLASEWVRGS